MHVIIVILIAAAVIWQIHKRFANCNKIFRFLMIFGVSCFFVTFVLPSFGNLLWWLELPAIYETTTIKASDGRYYSATIPLQRIQRYSSDGRFELGWFVNASGGIFAIGLTKDGEVVSLSARTKYLEIFNSDGSYKHLPIKYSNGITVSPFGDALRPNEFEPIGISLIKPTSAKNPELSLWTFLLFPFWHPFVAWGISFAGCISALIERLIKSPNENRYLE